MCDYLCFDMSNILHRSYFANQEDNIELKMSLTINSTLLTLRKYFNQFKPKKKIIMAFDRPSWRKDYTSDTTICVSGKIYKGHRKLSMTQSERERYNHFLNNMAIFEELISKYTSIICLSGDKLEADDLIAGFTQIFNEDEIVIVSADRDFVQLLDNKNIQLIDPATGKDRRHDEKVWNGDAKYFLFEKCFRGDDGDNVPNAYPRLRSAKIQKAYEDSFSFLNLMKDTWTNADGKEFLVQDLFDENKLLIDLTQQPECVKINIYETIESAIESEQKFSYFHLMKFLGQYGLKKVADTVDNFVPLFSK